MKTHKKVLGISASPRRGGNTDFLLHRFLDGARLAGARIEHVILNDLDFRPCQECGGCSKTGRCVLRDDLSPVYRKIEDSDILAVASPVFFGTVTAQFKAMIDRFQCAWIRRNVLKIGSGLFRKKRDGVFLCAAGDKNRRYFEKSKVMARIFFNTVGARYAGGLYCGGVEARGGISATDGISKRAFRLGEKLARR